MKLMRSLHRVIFFIVKKIIYATTNLRIIKESVLIMTFKHDYLGNNV